MVASFRGYKNELLSPDCSFIYLSISILRLLIENFFELILKKEVLCIGNHGLKGILSALRPNIFVAKRSLVVSILIDQSKTVLKIYKNIYLFTAIAVCLRIYFVCNGNQLES